MSPAGVFVRPTEFKLSTLLQSLSIVSYFARKSGDHLVNLRQARAQETARILNFTNIRVSNREAVTMLTSQLHRIPLTKRSTMDLAALTQEVPFNERGVGLAEVASLVGINPATLHFRRGSEDDLQKALKNDDGMDRETTYIEVKAEKKSTPGKSAKSRSRLGRSGEAQRAYNDTGGFSGKSKVHLRTY